ncbi:MAG TPA: PrsW family glutamic-type intramembrane protease [Streptosporangiaceae bacterium]|nr:PrsW family glutamic-type intramembrane protease [Streptosporangiaceae bacterium]
MTIRGSIAMVHVCAVLLCVFGAGVLIWEFVRFIAVFPSAAVLAAVLELPVVLVGFVILRRLRPVHAPAWRWSAAALVWGATAAAGCALLANEGLTGLWAKGAGVKFASNWSASLSAPLNEEALKLCGVALVALAAPLMINGPLDGLIFGAITGLGFQAAENVTYGLNAIVLSGGTSPDSAVLGSALLRVATTGVGSHWTMTAVAGAGLGYLIRYLRRSRSAGQGGERDEAGLLPATACLIAGLGMHLLFDAPGPPIELKVGVNFTIVAVLYLLLSSAFVRRARTVLAARAAAGLVSPAEADSVLSRRRRRAQLRLVEEPAERAAVRARQREILAEVDAEAA